MIGLGGDRLAPDKLGTAPGFPAVHLNADAPSGCVEMSNGDSRLIVAAFETSRFVAEKLAISSDEAFELFGKAFKSEKGVIVVCGMDGNLLSPEKQISNADDFEEALNTLVSQYPRRDHILRGTGASGGGARGCGFSSYPGTPPQPSSYVQINSPDWSVYKHAISLSLDDVLALSCDIFDPVGNRDRNAEFVKRSKIAELRLEEIQSPPIGIQDRNPFRPWKYNLAEFRRWGEALGWTFPSEFPKIEDAPSEQSNGCKLNVIEKNRTGPAPEKTEAVVRLMLEQLRSGSMTIEVLAKMKQESGSSDYQVARSTFTKAREKAMSEFMAASNSNN